MRLLTIILSILFGLLFLLQSSNAEIKTKTFISPPSSYICETIIGSFGMVTGGIINIDYEVDVLKDDVRIGPTSIENSYVLFVIITEKQSLGWYPSIDEVRHI